jgi:hypothetical protein
MRIDRDALRTGPGGRRQGRGETREHRESEDLADPEPLDQVSFVVQVNRSPPHDEQRPGGPSRLTQDLGVRRVVLDVDPRCQAGQIGLVEIRERRVPFEEPSEVDRAHHDDRGRMF